MQPKQTEELYLGKFYNLVAHHPPMAIKVATKIPSQNFNNPNPSFASSNFGISFLF